MGYFVYILYSTTTDRYYTGFSRFRGKRRRQHRRGETTSTAYAGDWMEAFCMRVETTAQARAMEKKIKARGARRFLEDGIRSNAHVDPAMGNVLTIRLPH